MKMPPSPIRSLHRVFTICIGLFATALCPPMMAQQPSSAAFDKAAVTDIEFRIAEDNLDQFGFALPKPVMTARIIGNLAEWDYPIRSISAKPYSHTLLTHIGRIKHQATPVGFSFSSGNSDPRSPEFQKADVIPITCSLTANSSTQQSVRQAMDFSANPIIEAAKKHSDQAKAIDLLVDHMSTVCFNLLEDLELEAPGKPAGKSVSRPGWMPEIRIEIEEQPEIGKTNSDTGKDTVKSGESHKQITIHNQGTPVILKLGHERL